MAEFVRGINEVIRRARRLQRNASQLEKPVQKGGDVMLKSIRTNFAVGGRPAWKPLAASTLKRKRTNRILIEKGELLDSHELTVSGNKAEAGTNLDRAKYPYFGTRKMPRRNAILFQPEDITSIGSHFRRHVTSR